MKLIRASDFGEIGPIDRYINLDAIAAIEVNDTWLNFITLSGQFIIWQFTSDTIGPAIEKLNTIGVTIKAPQ